MSFITLDDSSHLYLVGLCGSGMKALAEYLLDYGCRVSGSDIQQSGNLKKQIENRRGMFFNSHQESNVTSEMQALVHSPAIPKDNPEIASARKQQIPVYSYPEFIGELMKEKKTIAVAGTHGKSTTAAMIAYIISVAEQDPSCLMGGELCSNSRYHPDRNGWFGKGEWFVVEACEYQQSFWNYTPFAAVITNIEHDHFDCYQKLTDLEEAFSHFVNRISPGGFLVCGNQTKSLKRTLSATSIEKIILKSHSSDESKTDNTRNSKQSIWETRSLPSDRMAEFSGSALWDPCKQWFDILHQGELFASIELPLPGEHNRWNALCAAVVCERLGISKLAIKAGLKTFPRIRRRFENRSSTLQHIRYDDYAHHPSEVNAVFQTLRQTSPDESTCVVFQPHQILRTERLQDEFAKVFLRNSAQIHSLLILPVYAARSQQNEETVLKSDRLSQKLCKKIRRKLHPEKRVEFCKSQKEVIEFIQRTHHEWHLFVTMGAGNVFQIQDQLDKLLDRDDFLYAEPD